MKVSLLLNPITCMDMDGANKNSMSISEVLPRRHCQIPLTLLPRTPW